MYKVFQICSFFFGCQIMSNITAKKNCHCPTDCNSNYYTYSVSSTKIEAEEICRKQEYTFSGKPVLSDFPKLMRNFEKEVSRKDTDDLNLCLERMRRMAYIRFQLSDENIVQIKKELRVTFVDQVANLGRHKADMYWTTFMSIFHCFNPFQVELLVSSLA